MKRKQVFKKVMDFFIFSFGVVAIAVALACAFQLLKFTPNEFIRSILTVVLFVIVKFTVDRSAIIFASIAILSVVLTYCFFGVEFLRQTINNSLKLVFPFITLYGSLLLAINLLYSSNPGFWKKVHADRENGNVFAAMLPDLYDMICGKSEQSNK